MYVYGITSRAAAFCQNDDYLREHGFSVWG